MVKLTVSKKCKGFISHRCREYDNAWWKTPLESYLQKKGIEPVYGCLLENDFRGLLDRNIQRAINKSDMFIAVITPTWVETEKDNIGWPKKEWEMWKAIKKDFPFRERCIGFIIDTQREEVGFISNLVSFRMSKRQGKGLNRIFLKKGARKLYSSKGNIQIIDDRLDSLVSSVKNKKTTFA